MTSDTSGRSWLAPSAYYDPDECCWKTSGAMFPSAWPTSSQTCPSWGMTRNGELYELPTPALPTTELASSSLLPTPAAQEPGGTAQAHLDRKNKIDGANRVTPTHLAFITALLPTPVADHSRGLPQPGTDYQSLPNVVVSLLPTPTSRDDKGPNQRGDASCLHGALLPTPRASDGPDASSHARSWSTTDRSLHTLVHLGELTSNGEPTNPPSGVGSASPDELPLDPPSQDEAESA